MDAKNSIAFDQFQRYQTFARLMKADLSLTVTVSPDCTRMDLSYEPKAKHTDVLFAVWSQENGQDDLHWYQAQKDSDGLWVFPVDLTVHNSTCLYCIHTYSFENGEYTKLAENIVSVVQAVN